VISLLVEGIKTVFGWAKEKSIAKHQRNMAQIQNETELLLSKQKANSEWEMAQLNDKDKVLRWAAFLLFASPLLAHLIPAICLINLINAPTILILESSIKYIKITIKGTYT